MGRFMVRITEFLAINAILAVSAIAQEIAPFWETFSNYTIDLSSVLKTFSNTWTKHSTQ